MLSLPYESFCILIFISKICVSPKPGLAVEMKLFSGAAASRRGKANTARQGRCHSFSGVSRKYVRGGGCSICEKQGRRGFHSVTTALLSLITDSLKLSPSPASVSLQHPLSAVPTFLAPGTSAPMGL